MKKYGRHKHKKQIQVFDADDELWIARIIASSPLVDPDTKRALAECARTLQLQIQDMRSRLPRLTVIEHRLMPACAQKLAAIFRELKTSEKVLDDTSVI